MYKRQLKKQGGVDDAAKAAAEREARRQALYEENERAEDERACAEAERMRDVDDEDEDEEDHGALYEVTCPNCGEISTLDEETLMDPEGDLVCPHCGATFDIELEGTEEDSAEETDKQDR